MKQIMLIALLLLATLLAANPNYVPVTTLAEDFGATWCPGCPTAWQGIDVLHSGTHHGEFISARLYTESGELSNPAVQSRFDYYGIIGVPAVVFNGKVQIDGSGDGIADGSLYNNALKRTRYSASPLKVNISSFSATTATLSGNVEMISPTENIVNAQVIYYLVENNVSATDTNVLRAVQSDNLNLTGTGSLFNFNKSFVLNPSWNTANLWAIAFVQLANEAIIQSASTLPLPTYNFRVAMDWNQFALTSDANYNFNSQPFWFYNLGAADSYTLRVEVDSAPANWYFNYCDEDGNCYPGSMDVPFSLSAGEMKSYHLNLSIGDPGIADFRFVVSSANLGSYSIPFHFYTTGMAADDSALVPAPLQLGNIYPNPLSQSGTIEINAAKSLSGVNLEIYNLKGRKVQTQVIANLGQGSNLIDFRPAAELPTGIYFYRLDGDTRQAKKFILLR